MEGAGITRPRLLVFKEQESVQLQTELVTYSMLVDCVADIPQTFQSKMENSVYYNLLKTKGTEKLAFARKRKLRLSAIQLNFAVCLNKKLDTWYLKTSITCFGNGILVNPEPSLASASLRSILNGCFLVL